MNILLTLFLLLNSLALFAGPAVDYSNFTQNRVVEILKELSLNDISNVKERAIFSSKMLLGTRYGHKGPSGEGVEGLYDRKDLVNLSKVNCTTFVEVTLGFSRTHIDARLWQELQQNKKRLFDKRKVVKIKKAARAQITHIIMNQFLDPFLEVKYSQIGERNYVNRNHFTSIDWIPNALQKGVLEDITTELFADAPLREKVLGVEQWYESKISKISDGDIRDVLEQYQDRYSANTVARLNYIPLKVFLNSELQKRLKEEKIVVFNMVKGESQIPVIIGHQGFIIYDQQSDKLFFRHASSAGKVKDVDLRSYILKRLKDSSWKTLGFNILRIME